MATPLLYTYYGDDFTGSTDVLEQLASAGVKAALFLEPPSLEELDAMPGLQAFGVAGDSRSQTPAWMSAHLPQIFARVRACGAPVVHYKVCSTFDSSPEYGSIGRALEIGLEVFGADFVPVVVGAPHLRRYVESGLLFAADPAGEVHRIDRHPMRLHPVTPMREPRLARHLSAQTNLSVGEVLSVDTQAELTDNVQQVMGAGSRAVVFDTVNEGDQTHLGDLLWTRAEAKTLFAVGSSGLTVALIQAWRRAGLLAVPSLEPIAKSTAPSGPLLVISGSCSAATSRQLRWALDHGFAGVPLDPLELLDETQGEPLRSGALEAMATNLRKGRSVVVYTSLGTPAGTAQGERLGAALGQLLLSALQHTCVSRVVLCGGDTSSHAVQQLGLRALTWKANLQPGVPLCQAHGDGFVDGLELVLKGGQVGTEDFFRVVQEA